MSLAAFSVASNMDLYCAILEEISAEETQREFILIVRNKRSLRAAPNKQNINYVFNFFCAFNVEMSKESKVLASMKNNNAMNIYKQFGSFMNTKSKYTPFIPTFPSPVMHRTPTPPGYERVLESPLAPAKFYPIPPQEYKSSSPNVMKKRSMRHRRKAQRKSRRAGRR